MKTDTKQKFSKTARAKYTYVRKKVETAPTEDVLASADKFMNMYDDAFKELAK